MYRYMRLDMHVAISRIYCCRYVRRRAVTWERRIFRNRQPMATTAITLLYLPSLQPVY